VTKFKNAIFLAKGLVKKKTMKDGGLSYDFGTQERGKSLSVAFSPRGRKMAPSPKSSERYLKAPISTRSKQQRDNIVDLGDL